MTEVLTFEKYHQADKIDDAVLIKSDGVRVLQRVAACCSVLQCAAACCSVLQRVAVC